MQKMKNSLERDAKNEEFVQGSNKEDIKVKFCKISRNTGILGVPVHLKLFPRNYRAPDKQGIEDNSKIICLISLQTHIL